MCVLCNIVLHLDLSILHPSLMPIPHNLFALLRYKGHCQYKMLHPIFYGKASKMNLVCAILCSSTGVFVIIVSHLKLLLEPALRPQRIQ